MFAKLVNATIQKEREIEHTPARAHQATTITINGDQRDLPHRPVALRCCGNGADDDDHDDGDGDGGGGLVGYLATTIKPGRSNNLNTHHAHTNVCSM